MTVMIGSLILIAAIASPPPPPAPEFRAVGGATARASVSVRVISGVSFGADRSVKASGAALRSTRLIDAEGQSRPANILEFQ